MAFLLVPWQAVSLHITGEKGGGVFSVYGPPVSSYYTTYQIAVNSAGYVVIYIYAISSKIFFDVTYLH